MSEQANNPQQSISPVIETPRRRDLIPSRRDLIKTAGLVAAAAAPAALPLLGANDKLQVAWIGTGSRGNYLMQRYYAGSKDLGQIVAVCDAYKGNLARAKDLVSTTEGKTPKTYAAYKD